MKAPIAILALALWGLAPASWAATIQARLYFDDYRDAFDTSSFSPAPPIPGLLQVSKTSPSVSVVDTLTTPDVAGSIRSTTLTLSPTFQAGDVTSLVDTVGVGGSVRHVTLGADPNTAGRIVLDYDFSPLGGVNAAQGNDHFLMMVIAADPNQVEGFLTIEDGAGNSVTRNIITELGVNLNLAGEKAVPFTQFPGVNFTDVERIVVRWDAGVAYDAEIAFLAAGIVVIPEPSTVSAILIAGFGFMCRRKRPRPRAWMIHERGKRSWVCRPRPGH